jgi:hypothetical protein
MPFGLHGRLTFGSVAGHFAGCVLGAHATGSGFAVSAGGCAAGGCTGSTASGGAAGGDGSPAGEVPAPGELCGDGVAGARWSGADRHATTTTRSDAVTARRTTIGVRSITTTSVRYVAAALNRSTRQICRCSRCGPLAWCKYADSGAPVGVLRAVP